MVAEVATHPRVIDIKAGYESKEGFRLIKSPGKTNPDIEAPVLSRTPGQAQFNAVNLFEEGRGHHLVQLSEIQPGNRKYLHRHYHAETIWVILEGEGEYYPDTETVVPIHGG